MPLNTGPTKIVVGCGYLGMRAARLWRDAGYNIIACTRSSTRAAKFAASGFVPVICDVTRPDSLNALVCEVQASSSPETLLYAVGVDRTSGISPHACYAEGLENVLAALAPQVQRVVYISSTGVYGSANGGWVDESTPTNPHRETGKASLAAEMVLAGHSIGRRSAILRLTGLYGAGRIPYLDALRAGEPIPAPRTGWLNLIHVDDASRIVVEIDEWLSRRMASEGPEVFCVGDGNPVRRGEYYAEVARLIGGPPPSFVTPPPDSPAASRAMADKRVRVAKLQTVIGEPLKHPSYREGLASVFGP